ncbi:hypothetical protein JHK82_042257 [Glycine max]|nr:hypothetical protein JHK82_042257 [Glycine max]KAG5116409.1 hypothetical protein JHK84_042522 [Glycine max]
MDTVTTRKISFQHELHEIHTVGTELSVTVTAKASVVREWLSSRLYFRQQYVRRKRLVVGLGVQWTGGSDSPADTLQLCVGRRCLIFQLAHAKSVPKKLRTFLLDASHTFVGFWNHLDRRKLESSEHGLEMVRDPLDLRRYAKTEDGDDLTQASVEEIVEKCLGFEVEQRSEISMSNWNDEYLSDDQIAYATIDARCAFLIGRKSRAWERTASGVLGLIVPTLEFHRFTRIDERLILVFVSGILHVRFTSQPISQL